MSDIAIRVENLSKRYRIGQRERYLTFRDVLARSFTAPFRFFRRNDQSPVPNPQSHNNYIWALKDVSFDVKQGEVLGIIGRNGAGKSTLLKILARITEPTEGYAEVRGRVGSLLEVGTGFHPELTGRENIYMSGAILGMKKREIDKKFDEIVAFAEIEKFIDTPVKHYSSGMYVRLAFAVAAHLDPEILLVDEVLAVGDAEFQKKCLGKMEEVALGGRTVLFVSHNMAAIQSLCSRGILLDRGRIQQMGTPAECISRYLSEIMDSEGELPNSSTNQSMVLGEPKLTSGSNVVILEKGFQVEVPYIAHSVHNPTFFITITDHMGRPLIHQRISSKELGRPCLEGKGKLAVTFPPLHLTPGVYSLHFKVHLCSAGIKNSVVSSPRLLLEVRTDDENNIANRIVGKVGALLAPQVKWSIEESSSF